MAEINDDIQFVFPTRWNEVNLEAWSDVYDVKSTSLSSVDINCVDIPENADQTKINSEHYFPPELMEKIACYLDGRTLLKFKLLSKACNMIVKNALQYNKLWKKICLNEIPKKYLIILVNKYFSGAFVPFDSLSEVQYERIFKNWLQWQSDIYNTTRIGEYHFLSLDEINKIICHKFDVKVVFSGHSTLCSLKKNETGDFMLLEDRSKIELKMPNTMITLNPRMIHGNDEELNVYIAHKQFSKNVCPLHFHFHSNSDELYAASCTDKLIDVDFNIYLNACCWIRETLYGYYSTDNRIGKIVHHSNTLYSTMYTSVVHHVIISYVSSNCIAIHDMLKNSNTTINSWLKRKYTGATAIYIYANTLFIGCQNSYLLAYRLRCWDDLINLKDKNLLLEIKLTIGRIKKLDVINFENVRAIVVASNYSINCIKIN